MPQSPSTISVFVRDRRVDVAPGTPLLRCIARLGGSKIVEGNYCWEGECGHCEVAYRSGASPARLAMACRVLASDGMRVTPVSRHLEVDLAP